MDEKSCGGCCCIEVPDEKKEDLSHIFERRREAFKKHLAGRNNAEEYDSAIIEREGPILSVDTLERIPEKRCQFLGFLDEDKTKIGCLAHPEINKGKDFRERGFYKDEKICQDFLCAAAKIYDKFSSWQKKLFRHAIDDWTWYELSDQEKAYEKIKLFESRLPQIEKEINEKMEPYIIRQIIHKILN